jgi:hypothetical protein
MIRQSVPVTAVLSLVACSTPYNPAPLSLPDAIVDLQTTSADEIAVSAGILTDAQAH